MMTETTITSYLTRPHQEAAAEDHSLAALSSLPGIPTAIIDKDNDFYTASSIMIKVSDSTEDPDSTLPQFIVSQPTDLFEGDLCDDELDGKVSLWLLASL
jgi:hypothetical protein